MISLNALDFINPLFDEYYYHSMRIKVKDDIQGSYKGLINRHLKTYSGYVIEVIPDGSPNSRIRADPGNVTFINLRM